mmetsp:Transcript_92237/g.266211  ORF Transcript_92237/g.266211 Transcript_92237/m.266211 type:complete len:214 (-) Transcript_92237:158-799(-)
MNVFAQNLFHRPRCFVSDARPVIAPDRLLHDVGQDLRRMSVLHDVPRASAQHAEASTDARWGDGNKPGVQDEAQDPLRVALQQAVEEFQLDQGSQLAGDMGLFCDFVLFGLLHVILDVFGKGPGDEVCAIPQARHQHDGALVTCVECFCQPLVHPCLIDWPRALPGSSNIGQQLLATLRLLRQVFATIGHPQERGQSLVQWFQGLRLHALVFP